LMHLARGYTGWLLALALGLYVVGLPHRLYADRVSGYLVFFVLGGMAADAGNGWLALVDRHRVAASAALFVGVAVSIMAPAAFTPHWARLVCGAISMPALHGLIRRPPLSSSRLLLTLGSYSFAIYLLNTPCIGLSKGLMLKLMPWDGTRFLVFATLLMLLGTFGSVLMKRWLFRPVPILDRMTS